MFTRIDGEGEYAPTLNEFPLRIRFFLIEMTLIIIITSSHLLAFLLFIHDCILENLYPSFSHILHDCTSSAGTEHPDTFELLYIRRLAELILINFRLFTLQ